MKVLITGAGGFIGSNLTRRLLKKGAEVSVILREPGKSWRLSKILSRLKVYQTDLFDAKTLNKTILSIKPEIVFHCATYGMFMSIQKDINLMINTNIISTKNFLFASMEAGCKKFINTGSSSEYGIKDKSMKETDVLTPENMYGATKAAATIICTQIAKEKKFQLVTLRLFSPYGPYEEGSRLIPTILIKKMKKENIQLGSKTSVRDFVYVEDVIDAYVAVLDKNMLPGEILNIGSGKQRSIQDIVSLMKVKAEWNAHPNVQNEPKMWKADMRHTFQVLGWKPKTKLNEGLMKSYVWFRENIHLYEGR